jgi:hypothetical protein
MSVHTRSQKLAQAAYSQIAVRTGNGQKKPEKEYVSFAKKFPALIHTCGLAQAVAFALAKKEAIYVTDLAEFGRDAAHVTGPIRLGQRPPFRADTVLIQFPFQPLQVRLEQAGAHRADQNRIRHDVDLCYSAKD